jgi:hypothetical protein
MLQSTSELVPPPNTVRANLIDKGMRGVARGQSSVNNVGYETKRGAELCRREKGGAERVARAFIRRLEDVSPLAHTPALTSCPTQHHNTTRHTTRHTTQHNTTQHNTTPPTHNTTSHTVTQRSLPLPTTPHHTTPHRTTPHHIIVVPAVQAFALRHNPFRSSTPP